MMSFSLIGLFPALLFVWALTRWFLRSERRKNLTDEWIKNHRQPSSIEIENLVREHGSGSNAFLTLYDGFIFFSSKNSNIKGKIAFVNTPYAWVGASEPLAEVGEYAALFREFAEAAHSNGKAAMLIPVTLSGSKAAESVGYGALMVGSEPTFLLSKYEARVDLIPAAQNLKSRGATVKEFKLDQISSERRQELNSIVSEWFAIKRITPMSFLNKIAPWDFSQHKKYFMAENGGRVIAFLAAIPIWPRQGWYLIDLLRRKDAPPGATDLLVLETLRLLKEQGVREVTLGVAPLSNLADARMAEHPILYRVLKFLYEKGSFFYRFKPFHEFKMKFQPSYSEPAYLVYSSPAIGLFDTLSLMEAFFPGGIVNVAFSGCRKLFVRISLSHWLRSEISGRTVPRSFPRTGLELLKRCKLTLTFLAIHVFVYFLTSDRYGRLTEEAMNAWGFSWTALRENTLKPLLVSPFLHSNLLNINLDIAALLIFCGLLECLGGDLLMAMSYLGSILFSNPLTSLMFVMPLKWIRPELWLRFASEADLGSNLGFLGCAGTLSYFLKRGWQWVLLMGLMAVAYAIFRGSPLELNHAVALVIGLLVGRLYLGR